METTLTTLQDNLGYHFQNPLLLKQALRTPGSITQKLQSYERLEFLGDRVLGLIISQELFNRFPEERQGDLSKRFVALVRQETLVEIAEKIGLVTSVKKIGNIPQKDITPSVLSDVMEAVIAAIYVDSDLQKTTGVILRLWMPIIERNILPPRDPKTELQEWAQARDMGLPQYAVTQTHGSAHQPTFTVQVQLKSFPLFDGVGKNKRAAEQEAAAQLLKYLESNHG